jgi:hypothetical protein
MGSEDESPSQLCLRLSSSKQLSFQNHPTLIVYLFQSDPRLRNSHMIRGYRFSDRASCAIF